MIERLMPGLSAQNHHAPRASPSRRSPWQPRSPAPSAALRNPAPDTSQPETQSSNLAGSHRSHLSARADNPPVSYPPVQMDSSPARTYTQTPQTSAPHPRSCPCQYSVSRRIRSRSASPPILGPAALTGARPPERPVHILIKNPSPTVARRKTAIGAIQATLSNPPRIGEANTVAPYFAANQFKIEVSEPPLSISVCNSPIITGETGHPTRLHSSSTCPHPHV